MKPLPELNEDDILNPIKQLGFCICRARFDSLVVWWERDLLGCEIVLFHFNSFIS